MSIGIDLDMVAGGIRGKRRQTPAGGKSGARALVRDGQEKGNPRGIVMALRWTLRAFPRAASMC